MKKVLLPLFITLLSLVGGSAYAQTITISSSVGDTVCQGVHVTFTATTADTGAAYSFHWYKDGAPVGPPTAAYGTGFLANGDTIYCFLTNAAGDTVLAMSDTIIMTVNPLPVISPIYGPDSVCLGDSIQVFDSTAGGIWSSGAPTVFTVSPTGEVVGIGVAAGGPTRVYYKLTNSCGADSVRYRVRVNVPAGPITGNTTICVDSTTFLRDTARGGLWSTSDSTTASLFSPMFGAVQGLIPGVVTIIYTGANACGTFTETTMVTVVNCDTTEAVANVAPLAQSCRIYPNPATGAFSVKVASANYSTVNCSVSNMIGDKISSFTMPANKETAVNLSVPSGVYFITISAGNERYTSKMVITQ